MNKEQHEHFIKTEVVTATIYLIPLIKVGCTKNWSQRNKSNRDKYGEVEMIPLETITATIREIADLEDYYHQKHGFGVIPNGCRYDTLSLMNRLRIEDGTHNFLDGKTSRETWKDPEVRKNRIAGVVRSWKDSTSKQRRVELLHSKGIFVSFDGGEFQIKGTTKKSQFSNAKSIVVKISPNTTEKSIKSFLQYPPYERAFPKMTFINESEIDVEAIIDEKFNARMG